MVKLLGRGKFLNKIKVEMFITEKVVAGHVNKIVINYKRAF